MLLGKVFVHLFQLSKLQTLAKSEGFLIFAAPIPRLKHTSISYFQIYKLVGFPLRRIAALWRLEMGKMAGMQKNTKRKQPDSEDEIDDAIPDALAAYGRYMPFDEKL